MKSTIDKTLEHVLFLARHLDKFNTRGAAVVILMELRVPTKCVGFELLVYSILLQHRDPTRALKSDIYLETKLHYRQYSEEQVEQAIRDAVSSAWRHGSKTAWEWYFSYEGEVVAKRPTNSDFISRIAYILELSFKQIMTDGFSMQTLILEI